MDVFEVIGIIAIVVSLLFVAYELRLSNRIAMRESRAKINDGWAEFNKAQIENPETLALMDKLREANFDLTTKEETCAGCLAKLFLNVCGLINSSQQAGVLPDNVLALHLNIIAYHFDEYPGFALITRDILTRVGVTQAGSAAFDRIFDETAKIDSANGT